MRPFAPRRAANPTFVRTAGPRVRTPGPVVISPVPGQSAGGGDGVIEDRRHRSFFWGGGFWPWWFNPWPIVIPAPLPISPLLIQPPPEPVGAANCPPPVLAGRIVVNDAWAFECFLPAYHQARLRWGSNAAAVTQEVLLALDPGTVIGPATLGVDVELRRRIELAVAILLGQEGIPTRFPPNPMTPRPAAASSITVPWVRALRTGWL